MTLERTSPGLLTDLYQLTMAHTYWHAGEAEREAVFHLSFRELPFGGGFALACGLGPVTELLDAWRFEPDDLAYLATLLADDGSRMFDDGFLAGLGGLRFSCDVDAVPEGTAVFANEPLLRVAGPILQAQLLETPLLNLINFQTLVATKAARVCRAAGDDPVFEFGLRRAQGLDGALAASRAAYAGGCAATSNVMAGRRYGIPVRGTHAHSLVMLYDDEDLAFEAFARAQPANCTFLVDTYDTLGGVRRAIEAGRRLRARGYEMVGIRLDSGDLATLARKARRILDDAGFPDAAIVASGDLDETTIERLKGDAVPIDVWGVGTRLSTGWGQPALSGVYKLAAVRAADGRYEHRVKLSEDETKASLPGIQQVRRISQGERFREDVVYDLESGPPDEDGDDLLVAVYREGERGYEPPALGAVRERARDQVARLGPEVTRLADPKPYPVRIAPALAGLRDRLVREARKKGESA